MSTFPFSFGNNSMGYGNSMNPTAGAASSTGNPYTESGYTSSSNLFGQTSRQRGRTMGELQKYYGEGMGSMIYNYLESGGGYNSALTQNAVSSQVNAMGQQAQLGASNLTSNLSAMGVSGSSSGMTNALQHYQNQATTQENSITSQEYYNMWNESQNRELSMLEQVAQVNAAGTASQSNWMDDLSLGVTTAASVAKNFIK
jgi:hypothetical protein